LEYIDKEFKKIRRSRKLPGGVVLVGGTAKLPGLVDMAKEVLELPAHIGHWEQIKRVVDGLDEQRFAPAVGLMLLDMYLGPPQTGAYMEPRNRLMATSRSSLGGLLSRFKKPRP